MKLVRRICVLLILLAITIGLMSAANAQTLDSIYDTNADGKVDLLDVTQTQRWFGTDYAPCDVDRDGEVSISDMVSIANAMEGKPSADTTQPTAVLALSGKMKTEQPDPDTKAKAETAIVPMSAYQSAASITDGAAAESAISAARTAVTDYVNMGGSTQDLTNYTDLLVAEAALDQWKAMQTTVFTIDFDFTITSGGSSDICFGMQNTNTYFWYDIGMDYDGRIHLYPYVVVNGTYTDYPGKAGSSVLSSDITDAVGYTHPSIYGKTIHERIEVDGKVIKAYFGADVDHLTLVNTYTHRSDVLLWNLGFRSQGNKFCAYDNIVVRDGNGKIIFSEDFSDSENVVVITDRTEKLYGVENGIMQVGFADYPLYADSKFIIGQKPSVEMDTTTGTSANYTLSASNASNLATVQLRLEYSGLTELVVEPAGEWFILAQSADNGVLDVIVCNMAGASSETDILTVSGTAGSDVVLEVTEATLSAFAGDGVACLPVDLTNATNVELISYPTWVGGIQVTNRNAADVLNDGTVSYIAAEGSSAAKIILNNASIHDVYVYEDGTYSSNLYSEEKLELVLHGSNMMTNLNTANGNVTDGVHCRNDLEIVGSGDLCVYLENNAEGHNGNGIHVGGKLSILDSNVSIASHFNMKARGQVQGISCNDLLVDGSSIETDLNSENGSLRVNTSVSASGSKMTIKNSAMKLKSGAAQNVYGVSCYSCGLGIENSKIEIQCGEANKSIGVNIPSGKDVVLDSGTFSVLAHSKAMSAAPILTAYHNPTVKVGMDTEPDSALTYEPANIASYKYISIVPTPTAFQYQHSNQLGLIEPWSLKANLYLYYEDGTAVTAKELDELRDYGAYFVWADDLGSPETLPTAEEIVNCEKAVRMDKAYGCVAGTLPSGEGLTATYSGIATYRLNTPMYVVFFVEEDAGIQYGPVKERSLKELAAQGETNTNFTQEEKAVYTSMKAMEDTITAHRANFTNIPDIPLMDAPVVEENMFGDYKTDLSVKHSLNIVLIEPWGIKFNGYINGRYADYGFVVSRKTGDLAEMLEDPDTHVFSLSNEDVTLRNTTIGTEISGIFNKDIYTYQMNENLYASFFVKDADGTYHFGVVKTRNILSIIVELVKDPAHSAEHAVYQAMIDMYHAVTAFRDHAN